jgi:hypothetical protein
LADQLNRSLHSCSGINRSAISIAFVFLTHRAQHNPHRAVKKRGFPSVMATIHWAFIGPEWLPDDASPSQWRSPHHRFE